MRAGARKKAAALKRKDARRTDSKDSGRTHRKGNLAVSFEPALATQVRDAAEKQSQGNVSAWLAEAARERLRLEAGWQYIRDFEARNGKLTDEELREADQMWPR